MVKHLQKIKFIFTFTAGIITIIYLTGCEQKTEKPGEEPTPADTTLITQPADTTAADTTDEAEQGKPSVMDVKGKWTGSFADHSATLTINEQNENEFSGTFNVAFREPMFKYVSGKINMDAMTFSMRDTRQTRDMGTYSGKITQEGKMNGTFTMEVDGKNLNFSLTKR